MTNEEKLQRDIEDGKAPHANDLDARAYQSVFRALGTLPGYHLPSSFADRVVQKLVEARSEKEDWKDFFWFGAGVFMLLMAFVIAVAISVAYLGFNPDLRFLSALAEYKGFVIIALILVSVFNRIDKRLVREKQYH